MSRPAPGLPELEGMLWYAQTESEKAEHHIKIFADRYVHEGHASLQASRRALARAAVNPAAPQGMRDAILGIKQTTNEAIVDLLEVLDLPHDPFARRESLAAIRDTLNESVIPAIAELRASLPDASAASMTA